MGARHLCSWHGMVFTILLAGLFSRQGASEGLPPTPYTAPAKQVAQRILTNKTTINTLDQEYNGLKQDLAKVIALNSKSNDEGFNKSIEVLKKLNELTKEYHAITTQDLGEAAEIVGKKLIDTLIKTLEPTQPEAALALKALKGGTDAAIVLGKIAVNRSEASKTSENITTDIDALNRLIAKDKAYRDAQAKGGTASYNVRNDPIIKELDAALANFPIRLEPIPENQGPDDPARADLDKALNENMTREMGADNPHLPDLLVHSQTDSNPVDPELLKLRSDAASADQRLQEAQAALDAQQGLALVDTLPRVNPDGLRALDCLRMQAANPLAYLRVDCVRYDDDWSFIPFFNSQPVKSQTNPVYNPPLQLGQQPTQWGVIPQSGTYPGSTPDPIEGTWTVVGMQAHRDQNARASQFTRNLSCEQLLDTLPELRTAGWNGTITFTRLGESTFRMATQYGQGGTATRLSVGTYVTPASSSSSQRQSAGAIRLSVSTLTLTTTIYFTGPLTNGDACTQVTTAVKR